MNQLKSFGPRFPFFFVALGPTAEIYYAMFWLEPSDIYSQIIWPLLRGDVLQRWLARRRRKNILEFATSGPWLSQENKMENKSESGNHTVYLDTDAIYLARLPPTRSKAYDGPHIWGLKSSKVGQIQKPLSNGSCQWLIFLHRVSI